MPCQRIDLGQGVTAIVCHGRRKAPTCPYCKREPADKLCDFKLAGGRTCDNQFCSACGTGVGPDRDYCPDHTSQPALSGP